MPGANGQYFVVEEGLRPGERIILEGVATLRDGAPIKPRVVNADSMYQQILQ
jgi:membrane fusion protein, multidrug efflux system